ncbi:hypothetical protein [Sediminicoccus sp. KRV36]|uniref:hypothetical protein n=1 Tax=Sediminicoccus sp. KRV36 TaxID=3133721 RepID=UPI00200C358A|nr:hypothetical protein [Sediminicoccus rosea]UPY38555.1 hypothetical protein LHU95_07630 [Sediminicoccus rosea]
MIRPHLALILLGLGAATEAQAWTSGSGPRGGSYAAGPRGAVAEGPRGGVAASGPRGAAVRGPEGNAAAVGRYGGAAVRGPEGNVAYGARPGYPAAPLYPVARPPAAVIRPVPVYPGYPTAGAVAAGVAVGAVTGAAVAAAARPAAGPAPMAIGAAYSSLPSGCVTQSGPQGTLFRCGDAWLRPYMQGTDVVYVVIPPP